MPHILVSQLFIRPHYPTTRFDDKTVIVTGSNVGLGREAARHFARLGAAKVILAVRNVAAGEEARRDMLATTKRSPDSIEVWDLDLSSYESVKAFARRAEGLKRLDVLCENAAIAIDKFQLAEGHERSITVNVISTFLLCLLLLPKLKNTAKTFNTQPIISVVTSEVHAWSSFAERSATDIFAALDDKDKTKMSERYPTTKLLEVLAVREIAPKIRDSGVTINLINPGLCHSKLTRDAPWFLEVLKFFLARSTEVGSRTLVAGAEVPGKQSHGEYMCDGKVHADMVVKWVKTPEGKKTQEKVWKQLGDVLEGIQPGILQNV